MGNTRIFLEQIVPVDTATFLGRTSASTGSIETLTAAQVTALLEIFTSGAKGLVPASGGGTANFLRADGTWAAPPGGGGGISDGDKGDITVSGSGATFTIDANAVTLAKIAQITTNSLLGRSTSGLGNVETITIGDGLDLTSGVLSTTESAYGISWTPVTATGTGSSQNITLPESGLTTNDVLVTVEGLLQDSADYSISGTTLTITATASASITVRKINARGAQKGGAQWSPTTPVAADFSTVRYGLAGAPTIADVSHGSGVYMTFLRSLPGSSWRQQYLLKGVDAVPFRAEAKISNPWQTSNNWHMQGIGISSTNASDVGRHVRVMTYVDGTSAAGMSSKCTGIDAQEAVLTTTHVNTLYTLATEHWMAIEYDGTNINTYWSYDGYAWYKNATEPASFFTGTPNLVGFANESVGSDGLTHHMWCPHFHVTYDLNEPMGLNRVVKTEPVIELSPWNTAISETLVNSSISSTTLPFDNTIPQISEGVEVLTCSLTPVNATSKIRVEAHLKFGNTGGATWALFALFVNGAANAVDTGAVYLNVAGSGGVVTLIYEYVPSSLAVQTFSVRAGNGIAGRTIEMNAPASVTFGGINKSKLVATEMVNAISEPSNLRFANVQTAHYTLVLDDANKYVRMNVATANNLTVPNNSTVAFPLGTEIIVASIGAGQTTIVAAGSVTINTPETLKLRKQYSGVTLIKVGINEWDVIGDLELA